MSERASIYGEQNTVLHLRMSLETILSPYLGKFDNGRLAIAVEPPQTPKPGTGLHCFIGRYADSIQPTLGAWQVTLRQYTQTDAEMQKMDAAIMLMKEKYPVHKFTVTPFSELTFPQVRFYLLFNVYAYN